MFVLGIVMAVSALYFLATGLRLLLLKDERVNRMFTGWSWMSETERAEFRTKYNMKNMMRFNGWTSIISSVYMAIISARFFFDFGWILEIILIVPPIPMAIGILVYSRKSKWLRNTEKEEI